jgi:hypothetical protein
MKLRVPKPVRDVLISGAVEAFKAALEALVESTDEDSPGGHKITHEEGRLIARRAYEAVREVLRPHERASS